MRDVPWEDNFKLSASAIASGFCEWGQVGIDVHIPHRKYQVKPHSSPWFAGAYAAAIVHINHFFRLYQHSKSFEYKVKFRRRVIVAKGFFWGWEVEHFQPNIQKGGLTGPQLLEGSCWERGVTFFRGGGGDDAIFT